MKLRLRRGAPGAEERGPAGAGRLVRYDAAGHTLVVDSSTRAEREPSGAAPPG